MADKIKVIKIPLRETNSIGLPYVPDRVLEYQLNLYGEAVLQVIPVQEAVSSSLAVTTFVLIVDAEKAKVRVPRTITSHKTKPLLENTERSEE